MARTPVKGPVVIPLTLQIKIEWGTPGPAGETEFTNIIHGTYTTVPPNLTTLAETFFTAFKNALTTTNWTTHVATSYAMRRVQIKDLNAKNLPWHISTGGDQAGTGAVGPLPAQAAVVVTSLTQFSGREWHGRTYLGGLDGGAQADARHHTATAGVDGVAFMQAIRAALNTSQITMVLAQRALNPDNSDPTNPIPARVAHSEPITGHKIVNNRLDTQRRRLGR